MAVNNEIAKKENAEKPIVKMFEDKEKEFTNKLIGVLEPMERQEKLDFLKKKKGERTYILKNSEYTDLTETEKLVLEREIEIISLEQIKLTNSGDKKLRTNDRLAKFRNGEL